MEATADAVLIVGGGLVGLSAAVFLARQGVRTILVEKHAGSSPHPRALGYTARTLELYRAAGLVIPEVPASFRLRRARVESLAGTWFEESPWTPPSAAAPKPRSSPHTGAAIAQDGLEPILRDRARELGADIRMDTTLWRFTQDSDGIIAELRRRDGATCSLSVPFLVAADGHRSPVREALGIGRSGRGHMRTVESVLFRAPLDEYLQSGVSQFNIDQPGLQAFLTHYGDGRWALMFSDGEKRDEATLRSEIHKAVGRDVPVDLITTGRWELSALIADRFSSGRVFLAGDAAHTLPPSRGGYGANTGIDDANNLAWKLAAVLSGASTMALLDTYDTERRPIAWLRHQQIFARDDYKAAGAGIADDTPILDDDAMEFGQLYRSTAVLGAGSDLPPAQRPEQWAGQPGTRAPYVDVAGESTLDWFQHGWVLVADAQWKPTAEELAISWKDSRPVRAAFGLDASGASLVRPDGYIAWRSTAAPADPKRALSEAYRNVSSQPAKRA